LVLRHSADRRPFWLALTSGLVLSIISLYAWDRIAWTYHRRMLEAYTLISCEQKTDAHEKKPEAGQPLENQLIENQ
jgi:hypothetical protein